MGLSASILPQGSCPFDISTYTFEWICEQGTQIGSNFSPCDNSGGLFGVEGTNNKITIDNDLFNANTLMRITLNTRKGATLVSSESLVNVRGPDVIPFSIKCTTVPCSKYSYSSRLQFKAETEVSNVDYQLLGYFWAVEPAIPKSSFLFNLSLFEFKETTELDTVYISLTVNNETNLGSATY